MRKIFVVFGGVVFYSLLCIMGKSYVYAEGQSAADIKQELSSDRQQIKEERQDIKENSEAGRAEETALRQQIKNAVTSGDKEKANQLKAQLKAMHKENVEQKQEDKSELRKAKHELRKDTRENRERAHRHPILDR